MRVITLNVEPTGIKLLTVAPREFIGWDSEPLTRGVVREGVVQDPAALASSIKQLLNRQVKFRGKVIMCLGGMPCLPRVVTVPAVKKVLLEDAVKHESERRMPVSLDELYLGWEKLDGDSSTNRYLVIGVPRASIDSQIETLSLAGITNYYLDLKTMALARVANKRQGVIVNLDIGGAEIVVIADGIPLMMRVLGHRKQSLETEQPLSDLVAEVTRTIDYYDSNYPDQPFDGGAPVYLTGESAKNLRLKPAFGQALGRPIASLDPIPGLPLGLEMEEYAANIGMTLGPVAGRRSRRVITAPSAEISIHGAGSRASPGPLKHACYIALVALALLLLVPAYQVQSSSRADQKALSGHLDDLNDQLRDAVKTAAPLSNLRREVSLLHEERIALLGQGSGFAEKMVLTLGGVPTGVTLESVRMSVAGVILKGRADQAYLVIAYAAQLESTGGFASVQIASLVDASGGQGKEGVLFQVNAQPSPAAVP